MKFHNTFVSTKSPCNVPASQGQSIKITKTLNLKQYKTMETPNNFQIIEQGSFDILRYQSGKEWFEIHSTDVDFIYAVGLEDCKKFSHVQKAYGKATPEWEVVVKYYHSKAINVTKEVREERASAWNRLRSYIAKKANAVQKTLGMAEAMRQAWAFTKALISGVITFKKASTGEVTTREIAPLSEFGYTPKGNTGSSKSVGLFVDLAVYRLTQSVEKSIRSVILGNIILPS